LEEGAAPFMVMAKIHDRATFNRLKSNRCKEQLNACKQYILTGQPNQP
jgi:hypothetical protein